MDILHFSTRSDPDWADPTTGHDMLDRLGEESRRTAHIMSYAARSEDADQLARDVDHWRGFRVYSVPDRQGREQATQDLCSICAPAGNGPSDEVDQETPEV